MNVFDRYITDVEQKLKSYPMQRLDTSGGYWPPAEKNPFLLERNTAVELGGYPKESVNLILSSSGFRFGADREAYLIGNPALLRRGGNHISFGKIVLLKSGEVKAEDTYDYVKSTEFADIRLRLRDVMLRLSSQKCFTNLRVGKTALREGFTIEKMAGSMLKQFEEIPEVEQVKLILILGDSPLYKELLPVTEKVRDVTVALNTMLDGMELDCGSCNLSEICAEVEGLRAVHAEARSSR